MLGTQVSWQLLPFGPLLGNFLPVSDFTASAGVKLEEDTENGETKVTGRELQTCGFSIHVSRLTGGNPRVTFELLKRLKGMSAPLYITNGEALSMGNALLDTLQTSNWKELLTRETAVSLGKSLLMGTSLGGVSYMLTAVEIDSQIFSPDGDLIDAVIRLSFTEDAAQNQKGGLRVFVNGKDITSSIAVTFCIYEMYAEGEADSLEIRFADTKREWAGWKPGKDGDTVKITDGVLNSGTLYIDTLKPENGSYTLRAYSVPKSGGNKKSRSFENISLPQLAAKIASDNKLEVKNYGVSDLKYPYVQQRGQSDLAFLHERCKLAGASFLVFEKTLCLYDEKSMEARDAAKTLTLGPTADLTLSDDGQTSYSSARIANAAYVGTGADSAVRTGRELVRTISETAATQADANRIGQSLLRNENKKAKRGEVTLAAQRELAAGSVVRILANGWAGNAFLYRVRHDLLQKKSKLWFRAPLDY